MRIPITLALMLALLPALVAGEPGAGMKRGDLHPEFTLPKVGGGTGSLSDYRGRKVVLFHFASW